MVSWENLLDRLLCKQSSNSSFCHIMQSVKDPISFIGADVICHLIRMGSPSLLSDPVTRHSHSNR